MTQASYVVANGTGAAVRSALNGQLAAIVSNNSGVTEPSTTYAYQWWADTTTGLLKLRNAANNAWITIGTLADANLGLLSLAGGTLTGALLADDSGTAALPAIAFDGDPNTGIFRPAADQLGIATGGVERVEFGTSEVVFNDGGANYDFRVEGDTNASLFKIDAGLDQVQVANLNGGPLAGTRNRIINGDMRIDQRNAGAALTVNSTTQKYPVDRFYCENSTSGVFTIQQSAVAPAGFKHSVVATVTTGSGTLTGSQFAAIAQQIEGYNIEDLAFGTADAKTITLSFWVRSSVTGTYGGSFRNLADDRSYPFTYAINVANTWEQKSISVAGDTTGTWVTNNGIGMKVWFSLGAGPSGSGTAGAWAGSLLTSATGATNLLATNGATFYITGVQLETGTVATPFERRSYGQELALCQRYYEIIVIANDFVPTNGTSARRNYYFKVSKRSAPTTITGLTTSAGAPTITDLTIGSFAVNVSTTGVIGVTGSALASAEL